MRPIFGQSKFEALQIEAPQILSSVNDQLNRMALAIFIGYFH